MIQPNYIYTCLCTEVYDGDTVTLDIDLGFKHWIKSEKIRLYGINAPEMKAELSTTRAKAQKSRDYVVAAIKNREINVQFFKNTSTSTARQEKYGRYLAVVWYRKGAGEPQINLNEELVALGLAREYMLD